MHVASFNRWLCAAAAAACQPAAFHGQPILTAETYSRLQKSKLRAALPLMLKISTDGSCSGVGMHVPPHTTLVADSMFAEARYLMT